LTARLWRAVGKVDLVRGVRMLRLAVVAAAVSAAAPAGANGLKIAFLGDSGAGTTGSNGFYAKAVFDMVKASGASLVLQNGDFDYQANPSKWQSFVSSYGIDLLMASGNHEEESTYVSGSRALAQLRGLVLVTLNK
jgi:hypothetical protein